MGVIEALSGWMVSPGLFLAGAAAIAVPILIHLFNRRRFRTVEWAAMDFLLEAQRKNRRRILIENLILLALRCLTVFLIGLVLARPFLPSQWTGGLLGSNDFERIVILDDSLSMQASQDNVTAFDAAKESLARMIRALATDRGNNTLTILTTTAPQERIRNGSVVNAATQDELLAEINTLEPSAKAGDMSAALQEVEQYLASQPKNINRMVYVLSDMRDRDWNAPAPGDGAGQPKQVLERIAKVASGCFVVDVGQGGDENLIVQEVRTEGLLIAGVEQRFEVVVANPSTREVEDVEVRLYVGDATPLVREIESIPAEGTASATFNYTFVAPTGESSDGGVKLPPVRLRAEAHSTRPDIADRLLVDSQTVFPVRLLEGIPVLLVDGDPSAVYGRAETFFLRRALAPRGEFRSGVAVQVATETELDSIPLDRYQVIFLCNVFRLSDERIAALEEWVRGGGSLVLAPGDQVEEEEFNRKLYRGGAGLAPFELRGILGDETEDRWVHYTIEDVNHPAFKVFEGAGNPFLKEVKIFRYWNTATPAQNNLGLSIPVRLSDLDHSIAVAEKPFGRGRVCAFALTLDGDWTNWPDDPSFLFCMQELVRHLAGGNASSGLVRVSEPIKQWIDLTQHRVEASIARPDAKKISVQAAAVDPEPAAGSEPPLVTPVKNQTRWRIDYATTDLPGFYEIELTGVEGGEETLLFAANVDPTEGHLRRINESEFRREVGSRVRLVSGEGASEAGIRGAQQETWWYLLWVLLAVLGVEQLLGLLFGRGR